MSTLRLEGVAKRYGAVEALRGATLEVAAGSRTAILGPSGSGKTTLLRIVAGFEAPDAGRVTLGDEVLAAPGQVMPAHRRGIGVVAQDGALFPHLTVGENIGFGLERAERAGRVGALAEMVGLDAAMLRRRPHELSGGQQQRVALARAMARQPRMMLLDEPFSALDTALRTSTREAVAGLLAAAGITTLLVTHDQAEALSFADRVVILRGGELLQQGTPEALYYRPASPYVAGFLGDAILLPATVAAGVAECALGRVPVAAGAGACTVLLRPEQIVLSPGDGAGRITAIAFGGQLSQVTVALAAGPVLEIRQASRPDLAVGMEVVLSVLGQAHVL